MQNGKIRFETNAESYGRLTIAEFNFVVFIEPRL